jgi:UDP-N-acetylmuramoylalanine--D-glutamate ligase
VGAPRADPSETEVFLRRARVVVVGYASTGRAVARRLLDLGSSVVVIEDDPQAAGERPKTGIEDRLELVVAPPADRAASIVGAADLVVVSPGVHPGHPAVTAADPLAVLSEIELAYRLARFPIVAVTGTNGKTTVTSLLTAMLRCSGIDAIAAGNIGLPLVELTARDVPPAIAVAEVSSFQLAMTSTFHPAAAVYLNLAEDHLDWHGTIEDYARSKARIWANQRAGDLAVANGEDQRVLAAARTASAAGSRVVTFGPRRGDFRVAGGRLVTPAGEDIVAVAEMARRFPHDIANALAAAAAAIEMPASATAAATVAGCREAILTTPVLPHRLELVGDAGGVRWYDDSKATTPSSVVAALSGFDSVVLIAGGRNKGLDLSVLATGFGDVTRMRGAIAIGESAGDVRAALEHLGPVVEAASMREAVREASALAERGDAVLLSPGCASFDWYGSYGERGDDFRALVEELVG